MNVLIVDDEYFACAALEKLVREYFKECPLPLSCVIFDDSTCALAYLKHNKVDLVMTDIRMSKIDGLELALQVQGMHHDAETVVISGYAEFTYAQTALKYNVADYLLKPISRSQIYACLDKRVENYVKNRETRNQAVFHQITTDKTLAAEQLLEPAMREEYRFAVMAVAHFKDNMFTAYGEFIEAMNQMKEVWILRFVNIEKNKILFIYYSADKDISRLHERVIRYCRVCCKSIKEEEAAVAISVSEVMSVSASLHEMYGQCKYAMNAKLLFPEKYIFEYVKIKENTGYDTVLASSLEYDIKQSFEFKDMMLTKNIINRQIEHAAGKDKPLSQLIDILTSVILITNKIINSYNYKMQKSIGNIPEIVLEQYHTIQELTEYFSCHIERIYIEMLSENPALNIVEQLLEYVKENYFLNISLAEIAKNVLYLNQSYISRLFKAQMGVSFSKYLLTYRLEKAMECISNNNEISIQEAAALTGFYDCSYFVKQFKKQYGETPGYYQKSLKSK